MALQLTDKRMLFDYAVTQLQDFLIECGRTTRTILQSDQEDFLTALITAVANKNGSITTRNAGAYSSQSQGNIVCPNQNTQGTDQPKLQQRHFNETSTHALDSSAQCIHHEQVCSSQQWMHTSYFNRWNREQHTPLCESGETVQYMLPTVKQFPKPEQRFYNGIWLGKDTTAGEPLLAIYNKIVRARTIRRQIMPHKYNQQLLDCVHTGPRKTPASALHTPTLATPLTMPATSKAPPSQKDATTSAAAEGKRQSATEAGDQPTKQKRTTKPTSPMATSPTHQKRPALPAPPPTSPTRERDDTIAEGSTASNSIPQQKDKHLSDPQHQNSQRAK